MDSKALQPPSCTPAAPPSRAPGAPGQRREVRRQQRPGGTVAGPHPMPRGAGLWGRGDQGRTQNFLPEILQLLVSQPAARDPRAGSPLRAAGRGA